jgi:FMN phosphatase YigB (HAD superfamily)
MFKFENTKCLLLDLDNTLVRISPLISPYFIWRLSKIYKNYCSTFKILRGLYLAKKNNNNNFNNYKKLISSFAQGSGLKFDQCLDIYERSLPIILSSLRPFFKPIKAARSFVSQLESNITLVLATNSLWPEYFAHMRLEWALLDFQSFSFITHAHNMKSCKPHINYYQEIIKFLVKQKISRDSCLYIGDNYIKDSPATKAGITTIILSKNRGLKLIKPASISCAALYEADYKTIGILFGISI